MDEFDHTNTPFGIRNRILIFALLVTLIPSLGLGWAFYIQTKKLLLEKVELELHNVINQAQREAVLWFKEHTVNMRVFSNSFVVSENMERSINLQEGGNTEQIAATTETLNEYLTLVQSQFQEYQRLLLFNHSGTILAQSSNNRSPLALPDNWKEQLAQNKIVIGEIDRIESPTEATVLIATPVFSPKQKFLGLLATEATMDGLQSVMESIAVAQSTQLSLLNSDGSILDSTTQLTKKAITTTAFPESDSLHRLYGNPMVLSTYTSINDTKVVGIFAPLPHLSWGILMEKSYDLTFAEILKLKNITLSIIALLLTFIGVAAFFLSYSILSPLRQLVKGAMQVAGGDLDVQLPVKNRDELGFTITIFNNMVIQLRKNRDQLEKLASVDSLTGLSNRKHIMDTLALHIKRYARHKAPFSILMTDLDHFKLVNDTYGHLAGDAVLVKIGKIFHETLRSIDTAGRYGGEEFLIILDNAGEQEAKQTAERIRKAVEDAEIIMDGQIIKVTISIGIATTSETSNMDNGKLLIGLADKALYRAKQEGRNRTVLSGNNLE